ncbi:MAG: hypothetical protein HZY73_12320 [Micropruina sp.]|nr:MAG: hypothetical protein HZY73_12320 [Micropruina sp.]
MSSLAFHDQRIVRLREKLATAQASLAVLTEEIAAQTADLADEEAVPISDAPTTAAEQGDDRSVVKRRNAERRAAALQPTREALSRLRGEAAALRAAIIQDQIELRATSTDRHSLWSVLLVRSAHLIAHYNRRASTYVRSATRRGGDLVRTPNAPQPSWLTEDAIPPVPDLAAAIAE